MSTTTRRVRDERGLASLSNLVGAALGAMIIGGLVLFFSSANDSAQTNVSAAVQEADAVKVLNRAGRDIGEADKVVKNATRDVVVEKVSLDPSGSRDREITRTRYAVVDRTIGGVTSKVMVRQVDEDAAPTYSDATFDSNIETVLSSQVDDTKTKFEYRTRDGATATSASTVGRVEITYTAKTKTGGSVELKSSAAVNTALGGSGTTGTITGPVAVDDAITVANGDVAAVSVLSNDTFSADPVVTASSVPNVTVTVNASNQIRVAVSSSIATPGYINIPYTLTDETGMSDSATLRLAVQVRAAAAAPTQVEECLSNGPDSFTIPSDARMVYKVNGTITAPGTYTVTGNTSRTITAEGKTTPAPGYIASGTTSWTFTWVQSDCYALAWVSSAPTSVSDGVGTNTIRWEGGPLRFVRVAGSDWNAASGLLTSVTKGQFNMNVGFGTRYIYFIDKNGDGVNQTSFEEGDTLDQYPAVPSTSAVGSDTNYDTYIDAAGTDRVSWSKGATTVRTDVRAYRSYSSVGAPYLKAGPATVTTGNTGTSLTLTGRTAGAETTYDAVAYTNCVTSFNGAPQSCPSFNYDTTSRTSESATYSAMSGSRAYQAPSLIPTGLTGGNAAADACYSANSVRTVTDLTNSGDNGAFSCANGTGTFAWTDNQSDHGQGAVSGGAFCGYKDDPGDCKVRVVIGGAVSYSKGTAVGVAQAGWNTNSTLQAYSCNLGGCAPSSGSKIMRAFPGPFSVDSFSMPDSRRYKNLKAWYSGSCFGWSACTETNVDEARVGWARSGGLTNGGHYSFTATPSWGLAPLYGNPGVSIANTGENDAGSSKASTGWRTGFKSMTGYLVDVRANSATTINPGYWRDSTSGVTGNQDTRVYTSPLHVSYLQDAGFCRTDLNNGWRYGWWIAKQVIDWQGNSRGGQGGEVRHMWYATQRPNTESMDELAAQASAYWMGGDNNPTWLVPSSWTNSTKYWANVIDGTTDNTWVRGMTGGNSDRIPVTGSSNGGRAHLRVEVFIRDSAAGYPDYADMTTWRGASVGGDLTMSDKISGDGLKVRASSFDATSVADCNAAYRSDANKFNHSSGESNWYTLHGGHSVTRRYFPDPDTIGNNGSPDPSKTSIFVPWKDAA